MAELPKAAQGTFDELLAGVEPDLAAIARRLRAIIRAVDVSTVETVRLGDNAATYGVGPKKMTDGYAYIMPMRGYINLGFYQGAVLADPERLLEGTGKGLRHVKIRSLAEANRPPVRALVATALAPRRSGATRPGRGVHSAPVDMSMICSGSAVHGFDLFDVISEPAGRNWRQTARCSQRFRRAIAQVDSMGQRA